LMIAVVEDLSDWFSGLLSPANPIWMLVDL
jgi:hypothetical protein